MTMNCAELMKINMKLLELMSNLGIKVTDYRFVDLYEEYQKMKREGEKYWYMITHLSEKYKVSESSVKRLIRRLSREVIF